MYLFKDYNTPLILSNNDEFDWLENRLIDGTIVIDDDYFDIIDCPFTIVTDIHKYNKIKIPMIRCKLCKKIRFNIYVYPIKDKDDYIQVETIHLCIFDKYIPESIIYYYDSILLYRYASVIDIKIRSPYYVNNAKLYRSLISKNKKYLSFFKKILQYGQIYAHLYLLHIPENIINNIILFL
jgi:hypothetical protein